MDRLRISQIQQRGYTLLELLVTLSIGASLLGITAASLKEYSRASQNAIASLQGFVKQVRVKAISRTAAYKVTPDSSRKRIVTQFANSCSSGTFTNDTALVLDLPDGAILAATTWSFCVNARGLVEANTVIGVTTKDKGLRQVEVLLGGGTREL